MRNKKGTHVGVILSFLIFVTFLAFLYSITQPATTVSRDKLDLLEYLKEELLNKFSEDLSTVTVTILNSGTCGKFENFDGLQGLNVVVKRNENVIGSFIENNDTIVESYSETMKFYYSNQFDIGSISCGSVDTLTESVDYEISIFRTTEEIFESKIINISESINDAGYYEDLKVELGLAFDDNFGFSFENASEDIIGTPEPDVNLDIYSEEVPIQYIDNEANIKPGFLTIRVW